MANEQIIYVATVLSNSLATSKNKGTPSIKLKLKLDYLADDPSATIDRKILYGDLWLSYKTTKNTLKTLQEVFRWKGVLVTDFNEPILVGKRCQLVTEESSYENKNGEIIPTTNILFYNRLGGLKPMDVTELQSLVANVQPMLNEAIIAAGGTPAQFPEMSNEQQDHQSQVAAEPGFDATEELPF